MEYLFLIKFSTREIDPDVAIAEIKGFGENIPYVAKVNQAKGLIAIVSFPDNAEKARIEAFCDKFRDYVAEINHLKFDGAGNVLTDGNNNVIIDEEFGLVLGYEDLAKWAHASMHNVFSGFGNYNNTLSSSTTTKNNNFDPNTENNVYAITTLLGGSGGKH